MFPSETKIRSQVEKVQRAKAATARARTDVAVSVRDLAGSPTGLISGFIFGLAIGWAMNSRPAVETRRRSYSHWVALFLPLARFLYPQFMAKAAKRGGP